MKKRLLSILLAGVMALSMVGCGGGGEAAETTTAGDADMKIAMITDSGDITDQSFNQTTYTTCKAWSEENAGSGVR